MRITNRRNGKIEFMRFVFCCIIMIFHGKSVMDDGRIHFMFSGRLGVEFFYLVSGYLMASSLAKISMSPSPAAHDISIARETERFLLRKLKALYPMIVIAFFMKLFIGFYLEPTSFAMGFEKIIKGIPNLFLIQQTGIQFYTINGTWYISSMLIAMAILFPLTLKYYQFMRRIGAGLIAFLLIGHMMQMTDGLAGPTVIMHDITYLGNIRALSEIALGMLCYEGAISLREIPFTKLGLFFLKILEAALYVSAILYMLLHELSKYDFFILLTLAAAVTISFSKCNYNEQLWDKPVFSFLGKSSLYIYLAHLSVATDLTFIVGEDANNVIRMIVFIVLAFLAATFLWISSMWWKKVSVKLRASIVK